MNKKTSSEKLMLINETLMLAKTSVAYCIDEAQPYEEVDVLKFALEKIVNNLTNLKKIV